jgi:hypothetical protein
MIIKSKPLSPFWFKFLAGIINFIVKKIIHPKVEPIELTPGYSYILMCNHYSFWDGIWAYYLCCNFFYKKNGMQKLYIMSVKKQMLKKKWLKYLGSFSIDPGKRSILESFDYAAEILSTPGNLLLYYPQGELESIYIRHIKFDTGISEIVPRIQGKCQLIWCSTFAEYFESFRPMVYTYMLDCGTNQDFDFEVIKRKANQHHLKSMSRTARYTIEPQDVSFNG